MPARSRRWYETAAVVILVIMGLLTLVFGVSVLFIDEPLVDSLSAEMEPLRTQIETFEHDANVLTATFAAGMGVFGLAITLTAFGRGERWAWLVLWYYPVFFVLHVASLGTVVPDLPFAVLSVMALLALAPRTWGRERGNDPTRELSARHASA